MARKLIGFPFVVFVSGFILLNWLSSPITRAGEKPLYLLCGYDDQAAEAYWKALHEKNLTSTETLALKVDLLFPIFYGYALLKSIRSAWSALGRPWVWSVALVVVLIAVAADWTENLALLSLLQGYMNDTTAPLSADLVEIASAATRLKFLFIGISGIALLTLVGKLSREGIRQ